MLEKLKEKPYFARIDFKSELYNENITLPLNDNLRKDNTLKKVR